MISYHLHCSVSEVEFEGTYREVSARWRIDFPEFARYFNTQGISGHFTNWKIYCSAPGIASTNNALESFNNVIKRCYTLNASLPSVEVKQKSEAIDESNYVIREERNALVTYQKHGNDEIYHVSCLNGTCTCRYYMKMGYCKHLLHAHALLNEDSDYVIIDHQFKYKGNTKITKRQRGRVRDASPALQIM
jgi:hypothetical protein